MLIGAIILFSLAAMGGLYLLSFILRNKRPPKAVAFIHGPLASAGILLLLIYAWLNHPAPITSIIIFILAAMGGAMLLYRDIAGRAIPKWFAIGHGLAALTGLVYLIIFAVTA